MEHVGELMRLLRNIKRRNILFIDIFFLLLRVCLLNLFLFMEVEVLEERSVGIRMGLEIDLEEHVRKLIVT